MSPNNLAGFIIVGVMLTLTVYGYVRLYLWDRRTRKHE